MDISATIDAADDKTCRDALRQLLIHYLSPAFSALPKKEIDLAILDALVTLGYISDEPNLYELVQRLRVTRAKARNLLYSQELRRNDAKSLDLKVKNALNSPLIQRQGDLFVLEIENPLVADHLRAIVQRLGHASDGSFSPSLIKLTLSAFTALIVDTIPPDHQEEVRSALIKAGAPDKSFSGVVKSALKQLGKKIAHDAGEGVVDSASAYLGPLLQGTKDKISDTFGGLFDDSHDRHSSL